MNSTKANIIEVSQFDSPRDASEDLQQKLQQLIAEAEAAEPVAGLRAKREGAAEGVRTLKRAHAHLTQRSKEVLQSVRETESRIDDLLIDSPANAAELDKALKECSRRDTDYRAISRAILQIVERRLPLAEILQLEAEAEEQFALAHELSRAAQDRIRRTAEMLAQAAAHEGEIAFDSKKTASGHLLAHAAECERRAQECWRWADERRARHGKLLKEI